MLLYPTFHFKKLRRCMLASLINQAPAFTVGTNKQIMADAQTARAAYSKRYKSQGGLEWIQAL
jgi:hypothetical protein